MPPKKSKPPFDMDATVMQLSELGIRRKQFIKARIRVLNAAGALVRRALGWQADLAEAEGARINRDAAKIMAADDPTKLPPNLAMIGIALSSDIATARKMAEPGEVFQHEIELQMRRMARQLPIWEWAKDIKGFSELGLAIIVAEAGRLDRYATSAKLRRRMGLAPFEKDGVTRAMSQWKSKGGLTADDWKACGYAPQRRAALFSQVGGPLIGFMGLGYRPHVDEDIEQNEQLTKYQKAFVRRLRYEAARDPAMRRPDTETGKESYSKHCAMRAQRYAEQRLLHDLWQAWRRTIYEAPEVAIIGLSGEKKHQTRDLLPEMATTSMS